VFAGTVPSARKLFNLLNLKVIMNFNRRDLTEFFPHPQMRDEERGSCTSASGRAKDRSACVVKALTALGLLWAMGASAQSSSPPANQQQGIQQQIDTAVEGYLQQQLSQEAVAQGWRGLRFTQVSTPQSNINNLALCHQDIRVKAGGDNRNWSRQRFSVQCSDGAWALAVATDVKVYVSAVVAKQVINRGETLSNHQLALREVDITKTNTGFYSSLDKVVGQGAKRRIRAEQLVTPALLAPAWVIQRGQQVTVVANKDGIAASIQGEALENGAVGGVIRVRNISSKKTIEAKVLEAGLVTSTY
jgi:flagella basal body P-ring formation protein FlgA